MIHEAGESLKRLTGGHSERYAATLGDEADMLLESGQASEAVPIYARARATSSLGRPVTPRCSMPAAGSVKRARFSELAGRGAEALPILREVMPIYEHSYTRPHPELAVAVHARGVIERLLGMRSAAITDLEDAIAQLEHVQADPGQLASVQPRPQGEDCHRE